MRSLPIWTVLRALILLQGLVVLVFALESRHQKVGYQVTTPGCMWPCSLYSFTFYECAHFGEPGEEETDPCLTDKCIINIFYYVACEEGDAENEEDKCRTDYDGNVTVVEQFLVKAKAEIKTCGDLKQKYKEVPNYPSGKCKFTGGGGQGRCFIDGCDGDILKSSTWKGRDVCQ